MDADSSKDSKKIKTSADQKPDVQTYLEDINLQFKEKEVIEKAKSRGIPYISLSDLAINPDVMQYMTREEAEKLRAMPLLQVGKKLKVAFVDPETNDAKAKIEALKQKGFEVESFMASSEGIKEAQQLYYSSQYVEPEEKAIKIEEEKVEAFEVEVANLADLQKQIEAAASERALSMIQAGAIKVNASDIHIHPMEKEGRVRFRIDGMMTDIFNITKKTYEKLVTQIKYQSHLKLNIKDKPQDGKYSFIVNKRKVDVRVSTLPVEMGETVVMRLLDPKKGFLSFEEIGFTGRALEWVKNAIKKPNGLILVTGPTGSGKTTTLYSMLNTLNTPEKKIITLEDPIEYHLAGIAQSEIDEDAGYDFITGFRAVLRQDPDVVMIGEIRDKETAEIAAQAALTGHIVLSTLHTNSAVESIPRLNNIGLPPFMVGPSLNLIIAQRLVRRLCKCAKPTAISEAEKKEITSVLTQLKARKLITTDKIPDQLLSPIGCDECSKTGYRGQMSIVEVINVDKQLKGMILNQASTQQILEFIHSQGFISMREDGVIKVLQGLTSLSEVWRVTV